jgi:hypothetical protein
MPSAFGRIINGTRYGVGSRDPLTGVWAPGGSVPIAFKASVQPLNGNEMASLPEGRRNIEAYKVYSEDFEIRTVDEAGQQNPDKLELFDDGRLYEVFNVEVWQNDVINHYKATCGLIG